ncbi:hypothetical protein HDU79_002614 [Rhizoclosmatium sp. JEL0117]|nr:hypothetical protein HDU79_002614 [Rhizoclosmatium sp. JEL0117]
MLSVSVESVKRGDFKTCSQSSFCVRQRAASTLATLDSAASRFKLVSSTLLIDESTGRVAADLVDDAANALFHFTFEAKEKNAFRTTLKEKIPLVPAFDLAAFQDAALVSNGSNARFTLNNQSPTDIRISLNNNLLLTIHSDPFRFEIVDADTNLSVFAFNERNSLYYEYQRLKSDPIPSTSSDNIVEKDADGNPVVVELSDTEKKIKQLREELHKDMWDESFGGKLDSKPKGMLMLYFWFE